MRKNNWHDALYVSDRRICNFTELHECNTKIHGALLNIIYI